MGAHLDLTDVTAGHPVAERELADLRSLVERLERERDEARAEVERLTRERDEARADIARLSDQRDAFALANTDLGFANVRMRCVLQDIQDRGYDASPFRGEIDAALMPAEEL